MPCSQNESRSPCETLRPAGWRRRTASVRSLKNCERSARTPARISSNTSIGRPPGLAAVFSISGGTAPISTALATRFGAVAADVARDLAAARRVADVDRVLQVERFDERREVVGVGVHVVAVPGLARAAVAAAVVRDAAVAVRRQEDHLVFPGVGAQRPAVAEDDRLPAAPVLVVDLRAVFGRDRAHRIRSLIAVGGGLGRGGARGGRRHLERDAGHETGSADQDLAARRHRFVLSRHGRTRLCCQRQRAA